MDRPAIVIRDIHHYGDDLTVPEAIARLCGGGPVTVTVTDPAPPGGDPRGNPRHGSDITVRPALGGQPELPPEISWDARTFETPAAPPCSPRRWPWPASSPAAPASAAARPSSAARRPSGPPTAGTPPGAPSPAPRPPPAATSPPGWRPATRWSTTCTPRPPWRGQHGICYEHPGPGRRPRPQPGRSTACLAAAEDAYFTAAGEAFWAEAERIARDRAAQHPQASTRRGEA